jgi:hypothetical protein
MRRNLKINLFILAALLFFTGCEYELSGEYNRNISKPEASHPGDLNLSFETDSIIIYETTQVNYSVNSFGLKFNAIEVEYLNNKFINNFNSSSSFMITPDFSVNGWFELVAKFYLGTGTGSVADRFKAENYVGTKTWKVKFARLSELKVELRQHLNKDSLVELYWIKPKYLPIIKSTFSGLNTTRANGDTTFYTLENYCGGCENYSLSVELAGSNFLNSNLTIDYPLPELKVEQAGPDSCHIYWKSDIRMNYILYSRVPASNTLFAKKTFVSHKEELPYFGFNNQFEVYFMPYAVTDPRKAVIRSKIIRFASGVEFPYSAYCSDKDRFFVFDSETGWNWYKTFLCPLPSNYLTTGSYGGFSYSNNSGSLLIIGNTGDFAMFRNGLLNRETLATGANRHISVNNVQVVDNSCVGFSYTNTDLPTYKLKNLGDDLTWSELSFIPDFVDSTTLKYSSALALTQSGKYLCSRGAMDFIIYDLSDHQTAKKIFSTPKGSYLSVINNPNQPNQVIVMTKNGFELRNCPGFELVGSFVDTENSGIIPVNVDTYSNVLLAWSSMHYHFYNLSTMKEILRINAPWGEYNNYARLSRNYIFNEGRAMDLTEHFKH